MQQIAQILPAGRLPRFAVAMVVAGLGLIGLTQKANGKSDAAPVAPNPPAEAKRHILPRVQIGKASWYGKAFQGKTTANGEEFNMNSMTAAHRTLPLGTWVRVTNLKNRKSILVRINDRGPMLASLMLDLSAAAARKLNISGLGKVAMQPVRPDDPQTIREMLAQMQPLQPLPMTSGY